MTFGDLQFKEREGMGGVIASAAFPNGYGVSVIKGPHTYGGDEGLYELAVVHPNGEGPGSLCYATPITDDVIGHLTPEAVTGLMGDIWALPEAPHCVHDR